MFVLRIGVTMVAIALLGAVWLVGDISRADDKPAVKGPLPPYYKKLGLRDDQRDKILKIRADYRKKTADLKRQMEKLRASEKEELEKVLTPEQLKRLRELRSGETPKPKDKEKPSKIPSEKDK
jgi:hypothetical protein